MDFKPLGDAIEALLKLLAVLVVFALPLALWKLYEIVIWVLNHVSINLRG